MIIKNTRKGFATLQIKNGRRSVIYKIMGGETINIPELRSLDQVVNKFLFHNGHLAEVEKDSVEPLKQDKKVKEKKKTKVEKAKEETIEYMADVNKDGKVDEEDLSIVHKAYSAKNKKNKKSNKKD